MGLHLGQELCDILGEKLSLRRLVAMTSVIAGKLGEFVDDEFWLDFGVVADHEDNLREGDCQALIAFIAIAFVHVLIG